MEQQIVLFNRTKINDIINAEKYLVNIIEYLITFDINTFFSKEIKDIFYELAQYNISLVCKTIKRIYKNKQYKINLFYLIALLTTINNNDIKKRGYRLISIINTSEHLFNYIHMHITLSTLNALCISDIDIIYNYLIDRKTEILPRVSGTGSGFRRAINYWYSSKLNVKNCMNFAEDVIKNNKNYGFSHKDVLSIVHLKATTRKYKDIDEYDNIICISGQVILAYLVYGINHAKTLMNDAIKKTRLNDSLDIQKSYEIISFFEKANN